jgi:hypothetical protein
MFSLLLAEPGASLSDWIITGIILAVAVALWLKLRKYLIITGIILAVAVALWLTLRK